MRKPPSYILLSLLALLLLPALAPPAGAQVPVQTPIRVEGLVEPVRVWRDAENIPHIFATNERDAIFVLGYVHAQDRFFQMDFLRRLFSGTLAELLGPGALESDVQLRTLGLRRAAEASRPAYSRAGDAWLRAYARGVNAWLRDASNPLPPEYVALEITRASIPRWDEVDTLVLTKGLAFGLSFDLEDIDRTLALASFEVAGGLAGFDGTALFFEDLYRSQPFDPTVSIPPAASPLAPARSAPPRTAVEWSALQPRGLELARRYRDEIAGVPLLGAALERGDAPAGSNWWIFSGERTESGFPLIANDPHLALDTPPVFYEAHVRLRGNGRSGMNVAGVTFAGTPGFAQACNTRICWGSTVHPLDVTDVYQEVLVVDPMLGLPVATLFDGQPEPLVILPQTFLVNQIGDAVPDNLVDAGVGPLEGGVTLIVPRRNNGPIVAVDFSDPQVPVGLSVQYTGWSPTRELEAFRIWTRAGNVRDFLDGLQYFDVGSQNWAYADIRGNIAYFASAEAPLREDLQLLNRPDGLPPFLLRDGTHTFRNEWLPLTRPQPGQAVPFEILPFREMPQVINPESGYVINANNDPVGNTLDNNPINQLRPGGGLYYLDAGYDSFRVGRIGRLVDAALADDGKVSLADMQAIQANNHLLDAEVLTPYIVGAFLNGAVSDFPPLAGLAADPAIQEAVGRLAAWDFSTPTGIPEGFDPGDDPANLPAPSQVEIDASVAATLYSVWRGQMIANTFDAVLAALGLEDLAPGNVPTLNSLRHLLDTFEVNGGVGASGINFFNVPGAPSAEAARDTVILGSLLDALTLLAGDDFAPAFANSTDQDDYRWGYLHRIVFDHPIGGPFNVPPGGGFADLAPGLPGVARAGGFGAVDASAHNVRADSVHEFMFGSGPSRRFVGHMTPAGPEAMQILPGGQSGLPGSPFQTNQLGRWLTNRYHPLILGPADVLDNAVLLQPFRPAN